MKLVSISNLSHPLKDSLKANYCNDFWSKLRGYMFKAVISKNEGIILAEDHESIMDTAIHMLFMRFEIAVIWLDSNLKVVDKAKAKKWHLFYAPNKKAQYVVETHPARFDDFQIDDQVKFEK